ncbi:MAG: acetylxylan esterase [candidate division KSB1 bacterium]|nr:acetylxylan esterase [candidate division KSB1 bacterium]
MIKVKIIIRYCSVLLIILWLPGLRGKSIANPVFKDSLVVFVKTHFPDDNQRYQEMMRNYFIQLSQERPYGVSIPRDSAQWPALRNKIKKQIARGLGLEPLPERTPLNVRQVGKIDCGDYVIEKIIFESHPGLIVPANVYVPKQANFPVPAVLNPHGHWDDGKAAEHVQRRCSGLARRGYIALTLDMLGYNERKMTGHKNGYRLFLANTCVQGIQVWDNMRAIDYLVSRPDVDGSKIGITGCSGGGTQAIYTALMDDRITVVVPVCGFGTFESALITGHCICNYVPQAAKGLRQQDILAAIAPRPILILAATQESVFPIGGVREVYPQVARTYTALGQPDHIGIREFPAPHEYNAEMRSAMYTWMDYWLKNSKQYQCTEEGEILPKDSLACLPGEKEGVFQTISSLSSKWLIKILARLKPPGNRIEWLDYGSKLRVPLVHEVFGGFPPRHLIKSETLGQQTMGSVTIEKLVVETEPGIQVPTIILRPHKVRPERPWVLYLDPAGKLASLETGPVAHLVQQGYSVVILDYRGTGETISTMRPVWKASSNEHNLCYYGVFFGKPLLGQRVWDVLAVLESLNQKPDQNIVLIGKAEGAMLALIAAALTDDIKAVIAIEAPASLITHQEVELPLSLYTPGLSNYADLDQIVSAIAPRPVLGINCLGPDGQTLKTEQTRQVWPWSEKAFALLGSRKDVQLQNVPWEDVPKEIGNWLDKKVVKKKGT